MVKTDPTDDSPPPSASTDAAALGASLLHFLDAVPGLAIGGLDRDGRFILWNKGAEGVFGWPAADIIGRDLSLLYPADAIEAGDPRRDIEASRAAGSIPVKALRQCRDGSQILCRGAFFRLPDGDSIAYGLLLRDITAEAAGEIEREAEKTRMIASIPDAMIIVNESGRIILISPAAERLFGHANTDIAGRGIGVLIPLDEIAQQNLVSQTPGVADALQQAGGEIAFIGRRKDGSSFPCSVVVNKSVVDGKSVYTGFVRDLTQANATRDRLAELQAELLHLARVGAMGSMAATLAHELNQPITAVANYVETLRAIMVEQGPKVAASVAIEALDAAASEALRAGQIIRRLREFVARGETNSGIEDLTDLIDGACALGLVGTRITGVTITRDIDPTARHVVADRVQTEQVLINLFRNALDTMENSEVRHLHIATRRSGPDMVEISIADTGPGLAPEVADRLFSAFVTTKPEGMGLGLSICRTIVESQGGRIWADANPDGGVTFRFTLQCLPQGD